MKSLKSQLARTINRKNRHVIDLGVGESDEQPSNIVNTPPPPPSPPQIYPSGARPAPRSAFSSRSVKHPYPGVNVPLERTVRQIPNVSRPRATDTALYEAHERYSEPDFMPQLIITPTPSESTRRRPLPTPPSLDNRVSAYDVIRHGSPSISQLHATASSAPELSPQARTPSPSPIPRRPSFVTESSQSHSLHPSTSVDGSSYTASLSFSAPQSPISATEHSPIPEITKPGRADELPPPSYNDVLASITADDPS